MKTFCFFIKKMGYELIISVTANVKFLSLKISPKLVLFFSIILFIFWWSFLFFLIKESNPQKD